MKILPCLVEKSQTVFSFSLRMKVITEKLFGDDPMEPVVSISPDMLLIALSTGTGVKLYRASGQQALSLVPRKIGTRSVKSFAWSSDSELLAVIFADNVCHVFNLQMAKLQYIVDGKLLQLKWIPFSLRERQAQYFRLVSVNIFDNMLKLTPFNNLHDPTETTTFRDKNEMTVAALCNVKGEFIVRFAAGLQTPPLSLFRDDDSSSPLELLEMHVVPPYIEQESHFAELESEPDAESKLPSLQSELLPADSFPEPASILTLLTSDSGIYMMHAVFDWRSPSLQEVIYSVSLTQACLNYLKSAVDSLAMESKILMKVFNQYVNYIKEDTTDLLESFVAGPVSEDLSFWLQTIVGEKGLKNWFKSQSSSSETIVKYLFMHVIPCCEKIVVLLHSLHGYLIHESESGSSLRVQPEVIKKAISNATETIKLAHDYMNLLIAESSLFRSFCSWLEDKITTVAQLPEKAQRITPEPETIMMRDVLEFIESLQKFDFLAPAEKVTQQVNILSENLISSFGNAMHDVNDRIIVQKPTLITSASNLLAKSVVHHKKVVIATYNEKDLIIHRSTIGSVEFKNEVVGFKETGKLEQLEMLDSDHFLCLVSNHKSHVLRKYRLLNEGNTFLMDEVELKEGGILRVNRKEGVACILSNSGDRLAIVNYQEY